MGSILGALGLMVALVVSATGQAHAHEAGVSRVFNIENTRLYLMAGDHRRASELCERAIQDLPSVEAYLISHTCIRRSMPILGNCLRTQAAWLAWRKR